MTTIKLKAHDKTVKARGNPSEQIKAIDKQIAALKAKKAALTKAQQ